MKNNKVQLPLTNSQIIGIWNCVKMCIQPPTFEETGAWTSGPEEDAWFLRIMGQLGKLQRINTPNHQKFKVSLPIKMAVDCWRASSLCIEREKIPPEKMALMNEALANLAIAIDAWEVFTGKQALKAVELVEEEEQLQEAEVVEEELPPEDEVVETGDNVIQLR